MTLRICEMSDIHGEFGQMSRIPPLPDPTTYDVVLLPGDIGVGCAGLIWADDNIPKDKPIVFGLGNHEFYRQDYLPLRRRIQEVAGRLNTQRTGKIAVLDPGVMEINGVVIIGATLWSSLELKGVHDHRVNDFVYKQSMADFKLIQNGDFKWSPDDHRAAHEEEKAFIINALKENAGKTCVVMTHFVPSQMCIDPIFANSPLNPYFTVDMDDVMLDYKPEAWYFGHTHSKSEMVHPSGTKLICNPAGYPGEHSRINEWVIHSF